MDPLCITHMLSFGTLGLHSAAGTTLRSSRTRLRAHGDRSTTIRLRISSQRTSPRNIDCRTRRRILFSMSVKGSPLGAVPSRASAFWLFFLCGFDLDYLYPSTLYSCVWLRLLLCILWVYTCLVQRYSGSVHGVGWALHGAACAYFFYSAFCRYKERIDSFRSHFDDSEACFSANFLWRDASRTHDA
jgi:hypothetical protein